MKTLILILAVAMFGSKVFGDWNPQSLIESAKKIPSGDKEKSEETSGPPATGNAQKSKISDHKLEQFN